VSTFFLKTVYNVYFRHGGIPTKSMLAASDWTMWKSCQFAHPHKLLTDLHQELGSSFQLFLILGDVVRIQPNHVSFTNLTALNDIYGHNTKSNKSELYQDVIKNSATPASVFSETLSFL
jgi:hypothetical protein